MGFGGGGGNVPVAAIGLGNSGKACMPLRTAGLLFVSGSAAWDGVLPVRLISGTLSGRFVVGEADRAPVNRVGGDIKGRAPGKPLG